ncbi:ABC transporter permease [Vallicoccus soli]|uniref:ABC transporter permease n=1 Tax=Vallicoccus soli TaxID=2339232 RepID=A0A3A3Z174_9ACTN|nr:ABC transporter permease [Vallicoccus soli]RJK97999.1 ABC transporter permease [Vallicoccus soli]
MGRYVLRRLLQMIPVVIGTTLLIFLVVYALPGDPFAGKCGDRPCPEAYVQAERARLNLDDPVFVQYGKYMLNLLQGDFGTTSAQRPVLELVTSAYQVTLKLAFVAIVFELVIGILAGVLAGLRRGSFLDNLVLVSTLFVVSIPVFVIGFVLQLVLGVQLGWFPATVGAGAPWGDLLMPGFVLGSLSLAYVARLTRGSIAENLRSDYVRTAVAKGLPRSRVVGVHTLRNSLIPVITFIGADFGTLLGGAIITEGIFNINGVGGLTFRAITTRENATVVAVVTLLVLVFLLVNLLVDLLYGVLDPRIRHE